MLCTFGNPTFPKKSFSASPSRLWCKYNNQTHAGNRYLGNTRTILTFQTLKPVLPRFLMPSSNLQGIKLKSVKMLRCMRSKMLANSINEKQYFKCWVTKKMKVISVREDSSIIEMIYWPIYTCFTNYLVR